jgi:hypothetical protein
LTYTNLRGAILRANSRAECRCGPERRTA